MLGFFSKNKNAKKENEQMKTVVDDYKKKIALLTPKEKEVYNEIIQGYNAKEIASKLNVSRNTIDTHLKAIFKKLNVHSKVELLVVYGNVYNYVEGVDTY